MKLTKKKNPSETDIENYLQKLITYYSMDLRNIKGIVFIDKKKTRRIINESCFNVLESLKKYYSEKQLTYGIKFYEMQEKPRISSHFIRLFGRYCFLEDHVHIIKNKEEMLNLLKNKETKVVKKNNKEKFIPVVYKRIFIGRGIVKEDKLVIEGL
ncbi:MAG: hypothetical protein N3E37_02150 [Candidatus Micrarchaeota archaeon]|nr:hypothetical protein [Candidatus Micrarchaeota archaeon]